MNCFPRYLEYFHYNTISTVSPTVYFSTNTIKTALSICFFDSRPQYFPNFQMTKLFYSLIDTNSYEENLLTICVLYDKISFINVYHKYLCVDILSSFKVWGCHTETVVQLTLETTVNCWPDKKGS